MPRLTAEQLARFRADYHQCRTTIVPLLDHIDVLTAERDLALSAARGERAITDAAIERCERLEEERDAARAEAERLAAKVEKHERKLARVCRLRDHLRAEVVRLQRQVEGHARRIAAQAELLSERAEKGSEALVAVLRGLLDACRHDRDSLGPRVLGAMDAAGAALAAEGGG